MSISIIIPTYNEADNIAELIHHLKQHGGENIEIIVVDAGSRDKTLQEAEAAGAKAFKAECKGRATQMNEGAEQARGQILYFVHADSFPPNSYSADIKLAIEEGHAAGCYRFTFDSDHPLLKINAYCTRFNRIMCRGGDQTLFITRKLFDRLEGYRDEYVIMEDYDLIQRIQERTSFKIIPKEVIVSARKYEENNYLRVQLANLVVFMMYFWGSPQEQMVHAYKRLINHSKF